MSLKNIHILLLVFLFFGCKDGEDVLPVGGEEVELTKIVPTIVSSSDAMKTRADGDTPNPVYLPENISRYKFVANDGITFTSIRRTSNSIPRFNYTNISFVSNSSGAWERDKTKGSDGENNTAPVRIYWSDATSPHTFIGYSLPLQPEVTPAPDSDAGEGDTPQPVRREFDWDLAAPGSTTYYGSIGNPTSTDMINYNPATRETEDITVKENGSDKTKTIPVSPLMKEEDLLLAYSTDLVAELAVAKVKFYHALSSVKVRVMLSDFYGSELDGYTIVEDMILKSQPTLYRWEQTSYKAAPKSNTHADNNPRDMKLWDYVPEGEGSKSGKTFTFYGITVPQERVGDTGYQMQDLKLVFTVKYPDPLKTDLIALKNNNSTPQHWLENTYEVSIPVTQLPVYFHPGQCTIINVKLNHRNEELTIGAQYTDWDFVPTPDEGNLKKNSTFLASAPAFNARPATGRVTVADDPEATEDDATWLYYKKENDAFVTDASGNKILLDIYGNTGTVDKPYTISTANQLLSFAYEVTNGMSFYGKYIKLDADIVMQKDMESSGVTWIGIGDHDHIFDGTFLGGGRIISCLKGKSLFSELGPNAVVEYLTIQDMKDMGTSIGVLADRNAGVVNGCKVSGNMVSTSISPIGAIVGVNENMVEACYHLGDITGNGNVAGIVGTNMGRVISCYNAGAISSEGGGQCYGIIAYDPEEGMTIEKSFYNSQLAENVTMVAPYGSTDTTSGSKTTTEMQKEEFVTILNSGLPTSSKYGYVYSPAAYPKLQKY